MTGLHRAVLKLNMGGERIQVILRKPHLSVSLHQSLSALSSNNSELFISNTKDRSAKTRYIVVESTKRNRTCLFSLRKKKNYVTVDELVDILIRHHGFVRNLVETRIPEVEGRVLLVEEPQKQSSPPSQSDSESSSNQTKVHSIFDIEICDTLTEISKKEAELFKVLNQFKTFESNGVSIIEGAIDPYMQFLYPHLSIKNCKFSSNQILFPFPLSTFPSFLIHLTISNSIFSLSASKQIVSHLPSTLMEFHWISSTIGMNAEVDIAALRKDREEYLNVFMRWLSNSNLKRLSLVHMGLNSGATLKVLQSIPASLVYLDVSGNQLSSLASESSVREDILKKLKNLEYLGLGNTDMSVLSIVIVKETLENSVIKQLDLSSNSNVREILMKAETYLKPSVVVDSLISLQLTNCVLSDSIVGSLSDFLKLFPNLSSLDLSQNNITDHGIVDLKVPVSLQILDLSRNNVGDVGIVSIFNQHDAQLSRLTTLNLQRNKVKSKGISDTLVAIRTLQTTITIRLIDLRDNLIGESGARSIEDFVSEFPGVEINLQGNPISERAKPRAANSEVKGSDELALKPTKRRYPKNVKPAKSTSSDRSVNFKSNHSTRQLPWKLRKGSEVNMKARAKSMFTAANDEMLLARLLQRSNMGTTRDVLSEIPHQLSSNLTNIRIHAVPPNQQLYYAKLIKSSPGLLQIALSEVHINGLESKVLLNAIIGSIRQSTPSMKTEKSLSFVKLDFESDHVGADWLWNSLLLPFNMGTVREHNDGSADVILALEFSSCNLSEDLLNVQVPTTKVDLIPSPVQLRKLVLENCGITRFGIESLLGMLKRLDEQLLPKYPRLLESLQCLSLSQNSIGQRMNSFLEYLSSFSIESLTVLDLSGNSAGFVSRQWIDKLSNVLSQATKLENLILDNNNVDKPCLDALVGALCDGNVKVLGLNGNWLEEKDCREFETSINEIRKSKNGERIVIATSLKISPNFSIAKDAAGSQIISLNHSSLISSISPRHGDMLFVIVDKNQDSIMEDASPPEETSGTYAKKFVKQDEIDDILEKQDGLIKRGFDKTFCRHGPSGMCDYCMPLEPYDAKYLADNKIKHLSFHSFLRKTLVQNKTPSFDHVHFVPPLDTPSFLVKTPCPSKTHPSFPLGICTKCQPSSISLQQQAFRMVDHVEFESADIIDKFIGAWRATGLQRFGYLVGRYEPYGEVPLGVKAVVCAVWEPKQEGTVDGIQLISDDKEVELNAFLTMMGLVKIGMVYTDLVDDGTSTGKVVCKRDADSYFLSSAECMFIAMKQQKYPTPCKYSSTGVFGSRFVTCVISGNAESNIDIEAYQISNVGEALIGDGIVEATVEPSLLRVKESTKEQYVPEVFYKYKNEYGIMVQEVAKPTFPVDYLLVTLSHGFPQTPKQTFTSKESFPSANREILGEIQDMGLLKSYLSRGNIEDKLNDFHLLFYLKTLQILDEADLQKLVNHIKLQTPESFHELKSCGGWQTLMAIVNEYQAPSHTTSKGGSSSRDVPKTWSCAHCTYVNSRGIECEMCGLPKE
ncbi:nuclear protein localization protein 4 [Nowakowskiella sp. JEL0407]|nr:nuclear protein localization protein 4 [Nowakowskiella sp. JEL0407]